MLAETLGAKPETRASRRTDGQQEQQEQEQQQRWSISSTGPGHFRISWLHDALLDGNNLRHRLRRRLIHSLLVQQSAVRQQSTSSCAGCRKRQTNACVCVCVCVFDPASSRRSGREREREKQLVPLGYQINSRLQKCGGFFFSFSLSSDFWQGRFNRDAARSPVADAQAPTSTGVRSGTACKQDKTRRPAPKSNRKTGKQCKFYHRPTY